MSNAAWDLVPTVTMTNRHSFRRSGIGAAEANAWQNELRQDCLNSGIWMIDLTHSPLYNWRALLASMSSETANEVVGQYGVCLFRFRILRNEIDTNVRNDTPATPWRHVLEVVQQNGATYHLHYHGNGTADRPRLVSVADYPHY